jgi:hypothetical protein
LALLATWELLKIELTIQEPADFFVKELFHFFTSNMPIDAIEKDWGRKGSHNSAVDRLHIPQPSSKVTLSLLDNSFLTFLT